MRAVRIGDVKLSHRLKRVNALGTSLFKKGATTRIL